MFVFHTVYLAILFSVALSVSEEIPKSTEKVTVISEGGVTKPDNTTKPDVTTKPTILPMTNQSKIIGNDTEVSHITVSRKGVSLNETVIKQVNVSTTTEKANSSVRPKKPLVTVGSAPQEQIDQKSRNGSTDKVPTIEYYRQSGARKADFVIPIVIVILSVPVVAIVINILYKRGKEWWSHRHYRRMDFLIDGMYNN